MPEVTISKGVVVYVRVSTEEQGEHGTSLATQEAGAREFCQGHGWRVVQVYRDEFTGSTLERPGLKQLLRDAAAGSFEALVVYDLDRLARANIDLLVLCKQTLPAFGVTVYSVRQPADVRTAEGRFLLGVHGTIAEYEREKIRERTVRGRRAKLNQGGFTGGSPPYGLRWNREAQRFEIVEAEATVYRRIFTLCIEENLPPRQIERVLEAEGVVGRAGKVMNSRHILWLLRSTAAYGDWLRNRVIDSRSMDHPEQGRMPPGKKPKRIERPSNEWVPIKVPPIVTKEAWDRAQAVTTCRSPKVPRNPLPSLLRGTIFCGRCGARVGIRKNSGYSCYARMQRDNPRYVAYYGSTCSLPFFSMEETDQAVWLKVEELIRQPQVLWDAVYGSEGQEDTNSLEGQIKSAGHRLKAAKQREERSAHLYQLEVSPEIARRQVESAVKARKLAELELSRLEGRAAERQSLQTMREEVFARITGLRARLGDLTLDEKREILGTLVPGTEEHRIELHTDGQILIKGVINFDALHASSNVLYGATCYLT